MSIEQLEQRLAAVERSLADVQRRVGTLTGGPDPKTRWWENLGPPMTQEQSKAFEEALAYGRYFRQTGQDPPPDWKPGDPIPEPVYEE